MQSSRRARRPRREGRGGKTIGESSERRGGSSPEGAGAAQPFGRSDGLTPVLIRREEVEELGRLGDHLLTPFGGTGRPRAFDESRLFETYRTEATLVKQNRGLWL
jgi:hypothetical protein